MIDSIWFVVGVFAVWCLCLAGIRTVRQQLWLLKEHRERQLELLSTIAENTAKIAEATETTTLTVWDHWQWIRERTS